MNAIKKFTWGFVFALLAITSPAFTQTISGSISGDVFDTQHLALPNAQITATDPDKKLNITAKTDSSGHFVLTEVPPGTYSVTVAMQGFVTVQRKLVPLHALDKISVGEFSLNAGQSETVTVTTQAALLQTESGERSDTLVAKQIENIQVNGRSPLDLVKLVPGVVDTANFQVASNGIGSNGGPTGIFVNGSRNNTNQITVDGITNVDTGSNNTQLVTISLDATAEFKILTSSYQAEYGRSSGAQIAIVIKGGTDQFHGSGYLYHRHEDLNANTWFNNRNSLPRSLYRYNDAGFTIGGPVIIPKIFPKGQDKLYFFFGQEYQEQLAPVTAKNITVPTMAERMGDFSQTVDQNGAKVIIKDSTTGLPFTDNQILSDRFFAPGLALLNLFPRPNVSGVKGYNYTSQVSNHLPRREDVLRIDYNINSRLRFFGHYLSNTQNNASPYGGNVFGLNFPLTTILNPTPGKGYAAGLTWIINQKTTNQFLFGTAQDSIKYTPATDALTRAASGINLPLLFPLANQGDIIPSSSFSGQHLSNSPSTGSSNGPYFNDLLVLNVSDGFSRLEGNHYLKAGIFVERSHKNQITSSSFNGSYNFGDTTANPYDSGYGYSNALLGVYQSFTQASSAAVGHYQYLNVEGYLQDTWKVRPNFTLDYGVRLAWYQPQYDTAHQLSTFDPNLWQANNAPRLYRPCLVGKTRSACDAATSTTLPAYAIGLEVPNSGDPMNGIVPASSSKPYLMNDRPVRVAPRLGFAYQPYHNGNTVLRGAAGAYYDRINGNRTSDILGNPPFTQTPTVTYGFAQNIASASSLVSPSSLVVPDKRGQIPVTYGYNLGVQQELGGGFVLDIAYVGMMARHLQQNRNLNRVPYGATFLAQNQDPTLVATAPKALAGTNALPANFLRPYVGYGTINLYEGGGTSNYNSLQTTVQRRMGKYLFMGAVYTWSKSLADASIDAGTVRDDQYNHYANYGPTAFDRRHVVSVNYVVTSPRFAFSHRVVRAIVNDYQLSGVTQLQTGSPFTPGFSINSASATNETGSSTESARVRVLCDPRTGSSNPYHRLNASCFGAPLPGSIGIESGNNFLNNPGRVNFDMALEKQFSIHQRVALQFRLDAFNVFNHPNFTGISSTVNFTGTYPNALTVANAAYVNGAVANVNGFGSVSSVADPRIVQVLLRAKF